MNEKKRLPDISCKSGQFCETLLAQPLTEQIICFSGKITQHRLAGNYNWGGTGALVEGGGGGAGEQGAGPGPGRGLEQGAGSGQGQGRGRGRGRGAGGGAREQRTAAYTEWQPGPQRGAGGGGTCRVNAGGAGPLGLPSLLAA